MTIPYEWIAAALGAIPCTCGHRPGLDLGHPETCNRRVPAESMAAALEGAAPLIAFAERNSIRQLAREVGASYQPCSCDPAKGIGVPNHWPLPFADLLAAESKSSPRRCGDPACEI